LPAENTGHAAAYNSALTPALEVLGEEFGAPPLPLVQPRSIAVAIATRRGVRNELGCGLGLIVFLEARGTAAATVA